MGEARSLAEQGEVRSSGSVGDWSRKESCMLAHPTMVVREEENCVLYVLVTQGTPYHYLIKAKYCREEGIGTPILQWRS